MAAVEANGDTDRTTFLIVSDHGQESVHKRLNPEALLKQAGLASASWPTPTFVMADGGFALVFQKNATAESVAALKKLFEGKPGVLSVLTPSEAAKVGWPTPATTNQAPDLLLYAMDDYAFAHGTTDEFVTPTEQVGQHGYPNTVPLMQAIFLAEGAAIQAKGEIPSIVNLDVGPTIAKILGLPPLPDTQGKVLTNILK